MNTKKIIWIVIAVVIIFLIAMSLSRPRPSSDTIKIGVILPMTGIAANYGEHQSNAIRMAIDEVNRNGGVLGKKIEMILEDDATDPKKEISAYQKLTEVNKVPVVIGADWDIMANALLPILSTKKVVVISPTASPDIVDRTDPYFFATIAPIAAHQSTVEKYLKNEAGTKIALIYPDTGWGHAHRDLYKKAAAATGKSIVAESALIKFDGNDIQREMSLFKSAKPDIILTALNLADAKQLIEKNTQLGLNSHVFGHHDLEISYETNGINKTLMRDVVVYKLAPPDSRFVEEYKKAYDKEPLSDADKAHDAVGVIAKAIDLSKNYSAEGIYSGLKKISDFQGVAGPIDYTKTNWPTVDTAYLLKFDGKDFVSYLDK